MTALKSSSIPPKFRDRDSFTTIQVEGALCAWEWMIENRDGDLLKEYFGSLGSSAMRHVSIQAGDICARAYDHMEEQGYEFIGAYDWEFVPDVCARLDWKAITEDNQYNGAPYEPDIHTLFLAMVAAEKCHQPDADKRSFQMTTPSPDQYIATCRAEAERQWGYGDLVSDHAERVTAAMEADENPAEFIKWLGEKYDLTPVSEWMNP